MKCGQKFKKIEMPTLRFELKRVSPVGLESTALTNSAKSAFSRDYNLFAEYIANGRCCLNDRSSVVREIFPLEKVKGNSDPEMPAAVRLTGRVGHLIPKQPLRLVVGTSCWGQLTYSTNALPQAKPAEELSNYDKLRFDHSEWY